MTGYSRKEVSYAAELAHQIAELPTEKACVSAQMGELAAWVEGAIQEGQLNALVDFLSECGPAGSDTYSVARELTRVIGSLFSVEGQPRILFAIPFLAESSEELPLGNLECRQRIERELELSKGLPFLSIRLCAYPSRRVELENLGPLEVGQVGRDLVRYAASKKLPAPVIGPGPEHLVWLGVFRLNSPSADALFSAPSGAELQAWRAKSRAWLEEELKARGVSYLDVLFPMRFPQALTAGRLYQLKTELSTARNAIGADVLRYRRQAARLEWALSNSKTGQLEQGEIWLPDERNESIESSLLVFARRNHLILQNW